MSHSSKMLACLVLLLFGSSSAMSARGAGYELRGERQFENSIDAHVCHQLQVGDRAVAWVFGLTSTTVGLVARICQEESMPAGEIVTPGATYGGTRDGWYVFDVVDGREMLLTLPGLNEFSSPTWCDRLGAYWGGGSNGINSLVLADLKSGQPVRRVLIGQLNLRTDNESHLSPATWSKDCKAATFSDERYLKKAITLTAPD